MSAEIDKAKAALGNVTLTIIGAILFWIGLTVILCAWLGWYGIGIALTVTGGTICLMAARDLAKADAAAKARREGGAS